jgi:hypothetical protein
MAKFSRNNLLVDDEGAIADTKDEFTITKLTYCRHYLVLKSWAKHSGRILPFLTVSIECSTEKDC